MTPLEPRTANPARLGGTLGSEWYKRLREDTGPAGIRVFTARVSNGYQVGQGTVWRRDGVAYLVEHRNTDDDRAEAKRVMGDLADFVDSMPDEARRYVKGIAWVTGRNPKDSDWADKYNTAGFKSAATAGSGQITVWDPYSSSDSEVMRGTLTHEVGHLVSRGREDEGFDGFDRSAEWSAAIEEDQDWRGEVSDFTPRQALKRLTTKQFGVRFEDRDDAEVPGGVTNYGTNSVGEDYAESYQLYVSGILGMGILGEGDKKVPIWFRDIYPERARLLDEIFPELAGRQLAQIRKLRG